MKKAKFYKKGIFFKFILVSFIFGFVFISFSYPVFSQWDPTWGYGGSMESLGNIYKSANSIFVRDLVNNKINWKATIQYYASKLKDWAIIHEAEMKRQLAGQAFKSALGYFLNQLAYDTATYLATGDKGQKPMFYTEGWGEYLKNVADNAAGTYLETLGREGIGGVKFNLCEPDLGVKVRIGLGIAKIYRPRRPACTFSKMKKNWEEELQRPDFLNRFQDMFNPWSNDLGIALTLQSGVAHDVQINVDRATLERLAGRGYKPIKEFISGRNKSPRDVPEKVAEKAIMESTKKESIWTGTIADAIDTFINTLIGRLMERWLKKGLVTHFPDYSYKGDWGGFENYEAGPSGGGVAAAKERFRSLIEPQFGVRGDYNILSELTTCPDPTKAGPTNCVITDNFRQAVAEKKTVIEAIEEGYLNQEGVFGFTADGLEPSYVEGYPYRSMIILRKFRIIPVGWELAAQYIKDHSTEIGTCNLGDMVACFDENDGYDYNSGSCKQDAWCRGLVDPFWVLKAPLNYCRREGPGPEIISEQISGQGDDSELNITRNDNYCADEQTCIQENDDGSCNLYGYCTEERRKWRFNGRSCDPKYNTCQTFRSRDGRTVSYLENTLDYRYCNADNVGCAAYCEDYSYANNQFTCDLGSGNKIYLDKDAEECDASAEGCHRFIRTKPGLGVNLLRNASFEEIDVNDAVDDGAVDNFADWGTVGQAVSDSYDGSIGLQLTGNLSQTVVIGPSDYSLAGEEFTLSFYAKNCSEGDSFIIFGQNDYIPLLSGDSWQFYQTTYIFPNEISTNQLTFSINSNTCIIDAIKLERGAQATGFSDYGERGVVYEKLAPGYLGCNGADDDPIECKNFVRFCQAEEVDCNLYTGSDGIDVPARVSANDYCPAECVGYNYYLQTETGFDSYRREAFIPQTAKTCSAADAGCDEFTNLDKLGQGAEAREYYLYLKQCIKPEDPSANCAEFYTWEGSAETGYQLRVFNLQTDGSGAPALSNSGDYDGQQCDDASDYNLATNPMCREFYDKNGQVHYAFYPYTIACSENCHPYRRTDVNIEQNLDAGSCNAAGSGYDNVRNEQFHWDAANNQCIFCKNGGVWNDQHQACIYMAIPDEGVKCSASAAGCREYTGSRGSNMRLVLYNDFEGSLQDWQGNNIELSNEALGVNGHSLHIRGNLTSKELGDILYPNSSYVLRFIAKTDSPPVTLQADINNGTAATSFTGTIELDGEWNVYELNMPTLGEAGGPEAVLEIVGSGGFYIDDIRLIEITDNYYLIKNSWQTPDVCGAEDIGCDVYQDREGETHYLHGFSHLCDEEAVGCELMIDTHNYADYRSEAWNDGGDGQCDVDDGPDCEEVPADSYRYVVYNENKLCNSSDQGCQFVGRPYRYDGGLLYQPVYLKNNPDKYGDILCRQSEEGCEAWSYNEGTRYFKDPGDQVCEWRQAYGGTEGSWGWYKRKIKRCDDGTGGGTADNGLIEAGIDPDTGRLGPLEDNLCFNDNDCNGHQCILDENDYPCTVDYIKTIGLGGPGNRVGQPGIDSAGYWAGICPAAQAGCTEYIDPLSQFSNNIIFNPDFSQDVDNNGPDGWTGGQQEVKLEPYTLYRLAGQDESGNTITLSCPSNSNYLWRLDPDTNGLINSGHSFSLTIPAGSNPVSALIYSDNNTQCTVQVGAVHGRMELRAAVIDYQLKQSVDRTTCNGVVNRETGCVLFNERAQDGENKAGLVWDADLTFDDGEGASPQTNSDAGQQDANALLKVSPDRVCNQWLACRSFIKDENGNNVCFGIGLCDSVDENGNCNNFIVSHLLPEELDYNFGLAGLYKNAAGYVKVGWNNNSLGADMYPLNDMKQVGEVAKVYNGSFELYGSNKYPLGWTPQDSSWDENLFSVINNPIAAQQEGVKYPRDGKSFLKFSPSASILESEFIDVEPGQEYVLSADMNTINFHPGSGFTAVRPVVYVITYNSQGEQIGRSGIADSRFDILSCSAQPNQPWYNSCGITFEAGQDWSKKTIRFRIGNNTTKVKIIIRGRVWYGGQRTCTMESGEIRTFVPSRDCIDRGTYTFDPADLGCSSGGGQTVTVTINSDSCAGNVYIDDIKLTPALENRSAVYTPQTCRLYPETDSLACSYYDDSGKYKKGWLGYCLEYDRYPGSPDACLLWYPVDKVKGEGIEEGAGYQDRFPLYYSIEADISMTPLNVSCPHDLNPNESTIIVLDRPYMVFDSTNDIIEVREGGRNGSQYSLSLRDASTGEWVGPVINDSTGVYRRWDLSEMPMFENVKMFDAMNLRCISGDGEDGDCDCHDSGGHVTSGEGILAVPWSTKIVQVVTPLGQNKYWSGRTYQGSDFSLPCNNNIVGANLLCDYFSDYPPFGAIVPPTGDNTDDYWSVVSNPYEWDSKAGDNAPAGNQPLYYEFPNTDLPKPYQPRMGQLYDREDVMNLFAQSYGVWEWQTGYVCADNSLPGGAAGLTETCQQDCPYGNCEEEYVAPDNAPEDLNAITAAWVNSGGNLTIIVSNGNYYVYNGSDPTGQAGWSSGSLSDVWNDPNAPSQYDNIVAAYRVPNVGTFIVDNSGRYYQYNGNWTSGDTEWVGSSSDAPSSYSDIKGAWYYDGIIVVIDSTQWYAYNFNNSCYNSVIGGPGWISIDDYNACHQGQIQDRSLWPGTGINTANITAAWVVSSGNVFVLEPEVWHQHRYNDGWINLGSSYEDWGYALTYKCVGGTADGADCDPTHNDCPGSECASGGRYVPVVGEDWSPPDEPCGNGEQPERPDYDQDAPLGGDYCAIPPQVKNIKVNGVTSNIVVPNTGFVNLTFNTVVDSQQLPLVMYAIDWGDGEQTVVSGVEMRDRTNENNPHSFYHLYSYWSLKARAAANTDDVNITCEDSCSGGEVRGACCRVTPRVKIRDNWGWCNDGSSRYDCDQWRLFAGEIIVASDYAEVTGYLGQGSGGGVVIGNGSGGTSTGGGGGNSGGSGGGSSSGSGGGGGGNACDECNPGDVSGIGLSDYVILCNDDDGDGCLSYYYGEHFTSNRSTVINCADYGLSRCHAAPNARCCDLNSGYECNPFTGECSGSSGTSGSGQSCTNECSPGSYRCVTHHARIQRCEDTNGDGCYEWGERASCTQECPTSDYRCNEAAGSISTGNCYDRHTGEVCWPW